jgi:hypothetical protein
VGGEGSGGKGHQNAAQAYKRARNIVWPFLPLPIIPTHPNTRSRILRPSSRCANVIGDQMCSRAHPCKSGAYLVRPSEGMHTTMVITKSYREIAANAFYGSLSRSPSTFLRLPLCLLCASAAKYDYTVAPTRRTTHSGIFQLSVIQPVFATATSDPPSQTPNRTLFAAVSLNGARKEKLR